jgi:hypothetical protein
MGKVSRGVLIISVRAIDDIEGAKKRVSQVSGVVDTEYNYLTEKLHVTYEGESAELRKTELKIKEALHGGRPAGKKST